MQLITRKLPCAAVVLVTLVAVAAAACAGTSLAKPTPVEVWRGGDDGLTLRLADAIEDAFRASPDFVLTSGKQPGTLVVTIPTNVRWKQVGTQTQVLYTIEFTSTDNQNLGASTGSCWDGALAECSGHVVQDAKIAGKKMH